MSVIEIVGGAILLVVSAVIMCVRQPSGLSTRVQPRVRRGCFSV